jgi:hypothetical protein
MNYYAITVTYTRQHSTDRITCDIAIQAASRADAIHKVSALIQTPEYQYIDADRVNAIELTKF